MITLAEVLEGGDWSGVSSIEQDGAYVDKPNLESTMDFAEHQRIVVEARGLLQGQIAHADRDAKQMFEDLAKVYNEATPGMVLVISKGIHQINSDAHILVRLVKEVDKNNAKAGVNFHLNVEPINLDNPNVRFQWKAFQFKGWAPKNGPAYFWPEPGRSARKDKRRNSISSVDLAAHLLKVREMEIAAEKLNLATERNANWQSVSTKFKQANTDLEYKPGPMGFLLLRDDGVLVTPIKAKTNKTAQLIYDGVKITRKNL